MPNKKTPLNLTHQDRDHHYGRERQLSFLDLLVGQYVKVSGKTLPEKGYVAVEITIIEQKPTGRIKAQIDELIAAKKTMSVLGLNILCDDSTMLFAMNNESTQFEAFEPGQMVKIEADYGGSGPVAKRVEMEKTLEFNIEQIEGFIAEIADERAALTVNGVSILCNRETIMLAE